MRPANLENDSSNINKTKKIHEVAEQTARNNLSSLIRMRWIAIAGQIGAISAVHYGFGVDLPRREMALVIGFQIFINLSSIWRMRTLRTAGDLTIAIELLLDVVALTMMLFLSGGAMNPFVSLLILQVIIAIILLPPRLAYIILLAAIAAHYWLLGNGLPLLLPHGGHGVSESNWLVFDLHLQGMFLSFTIAASLLSWFVIRIMSNLRQRDAHVARLRQQLMEEDHLVRLGFLASGAAHELGTPLTTVAITLDDWLTHGLPDATTREKQLPLMLTEILRCRRIVSDMLLSSGQERLDEAAVKNARDFLTDVVDEWAEGDMSGVTTTVEAERNICIMADPMLEQALKHLLDNAAEAGAKAVRVALHSTKDHQLCIRIVDNGPGFPPDILAKPGQPYLSHKDGAGRGLGLFLASNVMRRISGDLRVENADGGGAIVSLFIPSLEGSQ